MSSVVETSLIIKTRVTNIKRFLDSIPLRFISLGMTKLAIASLLFACGALAQESPSPLPTPTPLSARTVRISFVPPPIEGTISLGIYDPAGKLVRVLHRESETDDFTIGHDALITEWDGKNDAGEDLPAGKYSARGYAVGSLGVEGIDYFFNDWVTDENSPHIKQIGGLALSGSNLRLSAELASGEHAEFLYDLVQGTMVRSNTAAGSIDPARGKENTRWVVAGSEFQQLSPANEILRHLVYSANDPQPKAVAASDQEDKIFVLEQNQDRQRLRGLTLIETKVDTTKQQSISDWKVDFEKSIVAHKDFSLADGKAVATAGKASPEKITLRLQPNPLKRDKPGAVEVSVGFDNDGSYLKTADGLPLRTISDTPHLSRALLAASGEKALDVFQDDGAVVEQFRISNADQMMAFDCGDFELK
jgi:hypothetical protein